MTRIVQCLQIIIFNFSYCGVVGGHSGYLDLSSSAVFLCVPQQPSKKVVRVGGPCKMYTRGTL